MIAKCKYSACQYLLDNICILKEYNNTNCLVYDIIRILQADVLSILSKDTRYIRLQFYITCPGGGIGRRVGLKIRLGSPPVPVQVWLRAPF